MAVIPYLRGYLTQNKSDFMKEKEFTRPFHGMPKASYGECIRRVCRTVDELADGLCVMCWDRTSYKQDNDRDEEEFRIERIKQRRSRSKRSSNTGNRVHMTNRIY